MLGLKSIHVNKMSQCDNWVVDHLHVVVIKQILHIITKNLSNMLICQFFFTLTMSDESLDILSPNLPTYVTIYCFSKFVYQSHGSKFKVTCAICNTFTTWRLSKNNSKLYVYLSCSVNNMLTRPYRIISKLGKLIHHEIYSCTYFYLEVYLDF